MTARNLFLAHAYRPNSFLLRLWREGMSQPGTDYDQRKKTISGVIPESMGLRRGFPLQMQQCRVARTKHKKFLRKPFNRRKFAHWIALAHRSAQDRKSTRLN